MTQEEIFENNKIIAQYMGYIFHVDKFYNKNGGRGKWFKEAQYNLSWNWLMEVIVKILSTKDGNLQKQAIIQGYLSVVNLRMTWVSVVDYIKWHNENNKSSNKLLIH